MPAGLARPGQGTAGTPKDSQHHSGALRPCREGMQRKPAGEVGRGLTSVGALEELCRPRGLLRSEAAAGGFSAAEERPTEGGSLFERQERRPEGLHRALKVMEAQRGADVVLVASRAGFSCSGLCLCTGPRGSFSSSRGDRGPSRHTAEAGKTEAQGHIASSKGQCSHQALPITTPGQP